MNLDELKGVIDDEKHSQLTQYIEDLVGQRDSARRESISGRQSLKSRVAELEAEREALQRTQTDLVTRLGVESLEEIAQLDPKGQAEAARQYEAKLKRAEKEAQEKQQQLESLSTKYRNTLRDAAVRKAMAGHEWIDSELVESYVRNRLSWDEDKVVFVAEDGLAMPLEDGVAALGKSKPHLMKSSGAGGSGYRDRGRPASGGAHQTISRAHFETLTPAARMDFIKSGGNLVE